MCITRDFRTEAKRKGPALLPGGRHRASLRIRLMWIRQEQPANDVPPGGCAGPRLAMVIKGRRVPRPPARMGRASIDANGGPTEPAGRLKWPTEGRGGARRLLKDQATESNM